ncbi:MAG: DUF1552 domain-containing protein [Planctomycetes bacterium]|nr:DUF1552 domain-containing protein [Planctomycetota bacterium]
MNILNRATIDRRTLLRAGAVALGLPLLDAMIPSAYGEEARARVDALQPKRMVLIHRPLGTYHPYLVPKETGKKFETTRFLKKLEPFREQFTVFSGMGHPNYPNSHGTEPAIFTGVAEFNERDLHNSISLDQVAARTVGSQTRFPFLSLNRVWSQSLSWNEKGVPIPHEGDPATVFRRMFIEGTPDEVRREMNRLQQGKSILDDLRGQLKTLSQGLGNGDRLRIEVLTNSIREAEGQLRQEELWSKRPKPKVAATIEDMQRPANSWVGTQNKWLALMHLAIQTDSTRVIVFGTNEHGNSNVPDIQIGHHDASHHGKDMAKIEQLSRYEDHEFATFADFLGKLVDSREKDGTLLDHTQVLFTSNLGDASAHSSTNLPVLLAGGGFKHQGHVAFTGDKNKPLCNLYVRMLREMGVETDKFGSSNGVIGEIG